MSLSKRKEHKAFRSRRHSAFPLLKKWKAIQQFMILITYSYIFLFDLGFKFIDFKSKIENIIFKLFVNLIGNGTHVNFVNEQ
jgi:hypothetical protein